jgi:hypothetical protein
MVTRLEAEIAAEDALRMQYFKILPAWEGQPVIHSE